MTVIHPNSFVALAPNYAVSLAQRTFERGLAVTDVKTGKQKPIPVTATPHLISKAEMNKRLIVAAHLASAGLKMSRHALRTPSLRSLILDGLSPLERRLAEMTFERLNLLATTRVDFFVSDGQGVQALELNATIPAMQGYSDIAADTFIEEVGKSQGHEATAIHALQVENGSNSRALFDALLSGYKMFRPGATPGRIGLLCRRNDAQLTEQNHLCRKFREFGIDADVLYSDQLSGNDAVRANGTTYDLIYRHLFIRRLEEPGMIGTEYVQALLAEKNGTRAVVLNPPASQVEVKATFALLSQAIEDSSLAEGAQLSEQELETIQAFVPWTRLFRGPALLKEAQANPDSYVIKRSWDYGGRAVFVGKTRQDPSFKDRATAAYGKPLTWSEVCAQAEAEANTGGFVIQRLVETKPEAHLLCEGGTPKPAELFVDFSAYASAGLDKSPAWQGVCRGSISNIVNIVGGGGVVPLIYENIAQRLLDKPT